MAEDRSDTPNADAVEAWLKQSGDKETTNPFREEVKGLYKLGVEIDQLARKATSDFSKDAYSEDGSLWIHLKPDSDQPALDEITLDITEDESVSLTVEGKKITNIGFALKDATNFLSQEKERHFGWSEDVKGYTVNFSAYEGEEGEEDAYIYDYYFVEDGRILKWFVKNTKQGKQRGITGDIDPSELGLVRVCATLLRERLNSIIPREPS